ncbi:ABC transporter ATP-binding protein [Reinekea marina]|uniref:ATP-binding cassette domain-containing protein n=1 Tax=Reinekea marina TaxID=1310421 RepID=A0ABV7WQN0_9GAMM|nr:ABC transporter ATP-binding protein [Reinekea marina]MDN3650626.1 ABC transporter ATP-binding protein [Reinekea marina]
MTNVISVENLTKNYGSKTAVNGISFSVAQGDCFGLLGPNGAGKTTTIEMLEGVLNPSQGKISLFGEPANKSLYKRVGIQFQNTALQDYLTVIETVKLFHALYEQPMPLDELIQLCALEDILQQDARTLSGGQRQRLLLALALVNSPDLVFLDEPTTGLDPQARRNFWSLIEAIKAQGRSIVLTTHYMDEAQVLCDDIAIMDQGQIIASGSPEALLADHFNGAVVCIPLENTNDISGAHSIANGRYEIETEQVDETIQSLIQQNISLEGMQVKRPTLEDLFLKLTGHALRG